MVRKVKKILLVEPEGVLAEITAFRLELLGYQVEVVDSAEAALKKASSLLPDLVITDLVLGEGNANGLLEELTSREETQSIPIMVLSLDADLDRVTTVHNLGAADFLVVPFQPEALHEKVAKLLARAESNAEDRAKITA